MASDHIATTAALATTIDSRNPKKPASVPPSVSRPFETPSATTAANKNAANPASGTLQLAGYTMHPKNGKTK